MSEIPTADWTWINAAAERFERAWKQGLRPRIEDYLAEVDESRWPRLLEELLRVERELLLRAGGQPDRDEYRSRFPNSLAVIDAVFGAESARSAAAGASPDATSTAPIMSGGNTNGDIEPSQAPGTLVRYFGDYELIREIGRGGMGVVYKARQLSLNRPVALKMLRSASLASDDELRRFQNEAEAVALLDHPHIVPILEVGNHEGQRYFTMKLIGGSSLDKKLADYLADPRSAARLVEQAAEAVHHAHQRGILHRDLKPANILLDEHGQPYVTDFGLAKRVEGDSELTHSGAIVGTPAYMAPEQASGRRGAVTTSSDVYGLGAILYALLTGRAPFGGDSVEETLQHVRESAPAAPSKINPRAPRDLEVVCLKCLEKGSAERYPSAVALAADLGRFAAGEPVSARAAGVVERLAKWARRKPTLAAAYTLGLLALLLGGLGGGAVWQWRAAERGRKSAELARGQADTARFAEKAARGEAESQRAKFERFDYGRTIQVAHQEWREANVAAALALLDSTRADLRGWEWRYVDRLCHSELLTLRGHAGAISSASFSPDGSRIVTGSMDKTAKVWDAKSGAEVLTLKGHTGFVRSASFSPDGSRIVTGSEDMTAKVWNAKSGAEMLTLRGSSGAVVSASFSPDGSQIITNSVGFNAKVGLGQSGAFTAKVWDAKSGADVLSLKGHTEPLFSASFSADGSRVVTASHDKTARVWDGKTGALVLTLRGHTGDVKSASFSPDGSRVVTGSRDKTAKIWDARSGAELLILKGHTGGVSSASFSPDGSRIVTGSMDRAAKVWDARSGAELLTLDRHARGVRPASFSPDGSRIVTGGPDTTAKVWNAKSGALVLTLKGHTGDVNSASFGPGGLHVVTGSLDGTGKVWDANSGAEILTLKGHAAGVVSASFSPDGSRIVTGSEDKTAKVWDANSGAEVLTLKAHTGAVRSASFSPDGSRVLTASDDMTAKVWDTAPSTHESWATREALDVVESMFAQKLPVAEVITRIRHDLTIVPEVRDRALVLAESRGRLIAAREIEQLVQSLFARPLVRGDVQDSLRADATLSEPARAEALALAEHYPEDEFSLNHTSWGVVQRPGDTPAAYLWALRLAEAASRLAPDNGSFLNTLGVAQYRAGRYQDAVATLTRSDQLNSQMFGGSRPADLAFLAMAYFRLGELEKAQAALGRLTAATKVYALADDPASQGFLHEAEAVVLPDPVFPANPFAH
jgi:WD40 repeat protein/tRNA A-37 threonylcarbamoyl transferase component Bud32